MVSLANPRIDTVKPFRLLFKLFEPAPKPLRDAEHANEASLDRREFILELMRSDPEAFQSGLDVQYLMQCYPTRL